MAADRLSGRSTPVAARRPGEKGHNTLVVDGVNLAIPVEIDAGVPKLQVEAVRLIDPETDYDRILDLSAAKQGDVVEDAVRGLRWYRFTAVRPGTYRLLIRCQTSWYVVNDRLAVSRTNVFSGRKSVKFDEGTFCFGKPGDKKTAGQARMPFKDPGPFGLQHLAIQPWIRTFVGCTDPAHGHQEPMPLRNLYLLYASGDVPEKDVRFQLAQTDEDGYLCGLDPDGYADRMPALAFQEGQKLRVYFIRHPGRRPETWDPGGHDLPTALSAKFGESVAAGKALIKEREWGKAEWHDVVIERVTRDGIDECLIPAPAPGGDLSKQYLQSGSKHYGGWALYRDMPGTLDLDLGQTNFDPAAMACPPLSEQVRRLQYHLGALRYPVGNQAHPYLPQVNVGADKLFRNEGYFEVLTWNAVLAFQENLRGAPFQEGEIDPANGKVTVFALEAAARDVRLRMFGQAPTDPESSRKWNPPTLPKGVLERLAEDAKTCHDFLKGAPSETAAVPVRFPGVVDRSTGDHIIAWLNKGWRKPGRVLVEFDGVWMAGDAEWSLQRLRQIIDLHADAQRPFSSPFPEQRRDPASKKKPPMFGATFRDARTNAPLMEAADTDLSRAASAPAGMAVNSVHKTGFAFDMSMVNYRHGPPELPYIFARDQDYLRRMVALRDLNLPKKTPRTTTLERVNAKLAEPAFVKSFEDEFGGYHPDVDPPGIEEPDRVRSSWVRWQVFLPVKPEMRNAALRTLRQIYPDLAPERWYQDRIRPWELDYTSPTGGWFRGKADTAGYGFLNVTRAALEACHLQRISAFAEGWQGRPALTRRIGSDEEMVELLSELQPYLEKGYWARAGKQTSCTIRNPRSSAKPTVTTLEAIRTTIDFWAAWRAAVAPCTWRVPLEPGAPYSARMLTNLASDRFFDFFKKGFGIGWAPMDPGDCPAPDVPATLPEKKREELAKRLVRLDPKVADSLAFGELLDKRGPGPWATVGIIPVEPRIAFSRICLYPATPAPQLAMGDEVEIGPYHGEQKPVEWWHFQLETRFFRGGDRKKYHEMIAEIGWTRAGLAGFDPKTRNIELYRQWGLAYPDKKLDGDIY